MHKLCIYWGLSGSSLNLKQCQSQAPHHHMKYEAWQLNAHVALTWLNCNGQHISSFNSCRWIGRKRRNRRTGSEKHQPFLSSSTVTNIGTKGQHFQSEQTAFQNLLNLQVWLLYPQQKAGPPLKNINSFCSAVSICFFWWKHRFHQHSSSHQQSKPDHWASVMFN